MLGGLAEVAAGMRQGDIVAEKYRIEKILGAGGMGIVVAARHLQLDEVVAIKFLRPEGIDHPEVVSRFEREARAAVKIKSERVTRVIDVGRLDDGTPYMVMEYLEGVDLSAWVAQRGALPVEQAVEFLLQACEAIADAHGVGIVHRDLKPANLFCVRGSDTLLSVKVLDFGISKAPGLNGDITQGGDTRASAMLGSPHYMSPEQMQSSRDVDSRADIWGLGVTLYELLTGSVPFAGETVTDICIKIVTAPAPSVRSHRPEVPHALEQVVLRCLEKDRSRRFQNVAQLAMALAPFAPKRSRESVDRISRITQAAGRSKTDGASSHDMADGMPGIRTLASWGKATLEPKRRPFLAVLGVLVGVVGVAAVGLLLSLHRDPSHETTEARAVAPLALGARSLPVGLPLPSTAESTTVLGAPAPTRATISLPAPASARPEGSFGDGSSAKVQGVAMMAANGTATPTPLTSSMAARPTRALETEQSENTKRPATSVSTPRSSLVPQRSNRVPRASLPHSAAVAPKHGGAEEPTTDLWGGRL